MPIAQAAFTIYWGTKAWSIQLHIVAIEPCVWTCSWARPNMASQTHTSMQRKAVIIVWKCKLPLPYFFPALRTYMFEHKNTHWMLLWVSGPHVFLLRMMHDVMLCTCADLYHEIILHQERRIWCSHAVEHVLNTSDEVGMFSMTTLGSLDDFLPEVESFLM